MFDEFIKNDTLSKGFLCLCPLFPFDWDAVALKLRAKFGVITNCELTDTLVKRHIEYACILLSSKKKFRFNESKGRNGGRTNVKVKKVLRNSEVGVMILLN